MKNKIGEIFFGKNLNLSVLIVLGVFMLVGLGCFGSRKTAGTIPSAYLGDWQGKDGTTLSIRADGTGDYKSGGTKVTNGTAEVNEADKTISITFVGIGKTLKIDEPPTGDQMKLDGIEFRRRGGFSDSPTSSNSTANTTSSTSNTTSTPRNKSPFPSDDSTPNTSAPDDSSTTGSDGDVPSDDEVETLVKATMTDFTMGIEDGSLDGLHSHSSRDFRNVFTVAQMNNQFQTFFDKKDQILPILRTVDSTSANFSPSPSIRTEGAKKILVAYGSFPTRPYTTIFELEYQLENGNWKMQKIRVKM